MSPAITPEQPVITPLPSFEFAADAESEIKRLEQRLSIKEQVHELETSAIKERIEDLGLLAGDLADAEELDRNGEVI